MLELRDDRLHDASELSDGGGGRVARRRLPLGGDPLELGVAWPRRRAPDRMAIAGAILRDALAAPPPRQLVRDYSRFVPLPGEGDVRIPAADVAAWITTWDPPIAALLRRLP